MDGEYAFGLARVVAAWLQVGQKLTDDKIEQLKDKDTLDQALQKALRFINYRPRSEAELERKLVDQGFDVTVIASVIQHLKDDELIGDEQFSLMWIENRSTFRPRSHRILTLELRQKGVSDEIIEKTLQDAEGDDVLASRVGAGNLRRYSGLDWFEFRRKMSADLGRRGFSYEIIKPVVQELWRDVSDSKKLPNDLNGDEENSDA